MESAERKEQDDVMEASCCNQTRSPSSSTSGCISGDESSDKTSSYPFSGTAENDFIQAGLNLVTVPELTQAVEQCKDMVLETKEYSEERKWLVRHLIELRFRLEEAKEAEAEHKHIEPIGTPEHSTADNSIARDRSVSKARDKRIVLGHHFSAQNPTSQTLKCNRCCGNIWSVLHPWYLCTDCQYRCHIKCLEKVKRLCAHVRVCETPLYDTAICPEVGLAAQGYRCYECKAHITFKHSWVEPRQCDYDGRYYCSNCHWNLTAVMPSRVIHNWDFTERLVCCSCSQYLQLMIDRPVINLDTLNPQLLNFVNELGSVKKLRSELLLMKQYLSTCSSALKEKPKKRMLWLLHPHLIEAPFGLFSMQDLIDLNQGTMLQTLQNAALSTVHHIKEKCKVCCGKGFVCELCKPREGISSGVLFPFDDGASSCPKCSTVYHRDCWAKHSPSCPRCERLQERQSLLDEQFE